MIRLGHIEYSNCFPVHALLVNGAPPANLEIVGGTPAELNAALAARVIDVAPASSIEYARHADTYRLLPDFVIASDGPVGSIILESTRPLVMGAWEHGSMRAWEHAAIALPTASATAVVLLKILLRLKYGIDARYEWFDQNDVADPVRDGADAALWIGDVALRRTVPAGRHVYDLGAEWKQWTGLPFVFAAWQTSASTEKDSELVELVAQLHASRDYFVRNAADLATKFSNHFRLESDRLLAYWQSLSYTFDQSMQRGLLEYYRLAAQLGEAPAISRLRWLA
ncbi:MAG: menaquinone biosynthetic enzyme MqnA/MqnD family protein [Gemmatimonadota bacterium]